MAFNYPYYHSTLDADGINEGTKGKVFGMQNNYFSPGEALFNFTNFTFTTHLPYGSNTAGTYATTAGYTGPLLSQLQGLSTYSSQSWFIVPTYFRMVITGFQEFIIPQDGNYRIKCMGAGGGFGSSSNSGILAYRGGYGSYAQGTIFLNQGDWLRIIVGHCGRNADSRGSGGGGGGSFVLRSTTGTFSNATNEIIFAGGGGGGSGHYNSNTKGIGSDGGLTTSGVSAPFSGSTRAVGTNGTGGGYSSFAGNWGGGDGAGLLSDGYSSEEESNNNSSTGMGRSYANGMLGGNGEPFQYGYGVNGGFGGGGASSWAAGGGGGYSGGPGDYSSGSGLQNSNDNGPDGAGAGGLFLHASAFNTTVGNNTITDHGYVEVERL